MTWCFRVRAEIRETSKLECTSPEWVIEDRGPGQQVKLISRTPVSIENPAPLSEARSVNLRGWRARLVRAFARIRDRGPGHISRTPVSIDNPVPLSEARSINLRGSGYSSEDEAIAAGEVWRARLMRAFAGIRVGADFGDRAPQGAFTEAGLAAFSAQDRRVLNDVHGLMVFECDPPPVFVRLGPLTAMVSSPHERLVQAMNNAIETGGLSEERQVTYDLFSASFGQRSADARFALLMMALESLIKPAPRSADSRNHVQQIIKATEQSGLAKSEIESIRGALNWLLDESIGQAGRRLARTLEPRKYNNETPATFFTHCYELRSRLMHGVHPLPTRGEIDAWAAPLEVFVADLLSE